MGGEGGGVFEVTSDLEWERESVSVSVCEREEWEWGERGGRCVVDGK